ncbi:MAG: glycosyltransferase family 2 protein [Coriobacteriales bacterium]|jgi:GT2 family glycosyltransferase|nr:glycosyltransferase family 2 protein [Coriobacteriales bacterium]
MKAAAQPKRRKHRIISVNNVVRFFESVHTFGLTVTIRRVLSRLGLRRPQPFDAGFVLSQAIFEQQRSHLFGTQHTFSLLVPLYNTPLEFLRPMIESVQHQSYAHWELCLADASDDTHAETGAWCRQCAKVDERIKYRKLDRNKGIAANTNRCLELASGDYLALIDHDDLLHPSALYWVAKAIDELGADMLYTDEILFDKTFADAHSPHFKPAFSPDTLRSYNYITHFLVFSQDLQQKVGLFRSECDGSQDYDMTLRLSEKARCITHIPRVLYYWRRHGDSYSQATRLLLRCINSAKRALSDHLKRVKLSGSIGDALLPTTYRVRYELTTRPLISIIIPNKDHVRDLRRCLKSLMVKTTYRHFELLIVENNSEDNATFAFYRSLTEQIKEWCPAGDSAAREATAPEAAREATTPETKCKLATPEAAREPEATRELATPEVHILTYPGAFNFSAINNRAVQHAKGEVLLFLNNDTEIITPDWLEEMLMFAQRADVAAVGARLLFPDDTVQHAGLIVGIGGMAGHAHKGFEGNAPGYVHRLQVAQNLSAVTGACLMVRADVFREVGGFDENLAVALNDVDLCMKFRAVGYLNVYTPFAELYHHESKSRGYEDTPQKLKRFQDETRAFQERWHRELEAGDPYYSPWLSLERQDFALRIHDLNESPAHQREALSRTLFRCQPSRPRPPYPFSEDTD